MNKVLSTIILFICASVTLQAYAIYTTGNGTVSGACDNGDGFSAVYDHTNFYISNTTSGGHATGSSFGNAIRKSCANSPKKSNKNIVTLKKDSLVYYKEKAMLNSLSSQLTHDMETTMAGLSSEFAYPRIIQRVQLVKRYRSPKGYIDNYVKIKTGDGKSYYVRSSAIY